MCGRMVWCDVVMVVVIVNDYYDVRRRCQSTHKCKLTVLDICMLCLHYCVWCGLLLQYKMSERRMVYGKVVVEKDTWCVDDGGSDVFVASSLQCLYGVCSYRVRSADYI